MKQYDTLMRYLAYEGSAYWARSQHFLVANAALVGFFATSRMTEGIDKVTWFHLTLLFIGCLAGLSLTVLWHKALSSGEYWTARWQNILAEIEEDAWGARHVLRQTNVRNSAKSVARSCAWLFVLVWFAFGLLLSGAALAKIGYCDQNTAPICKLYRTNAVVTP